MFLDVHSVKWSKPHWMTYCMLDNLLLYLCLKGCIFKVSSSRDGWVGVGVGVGLMFVSTFEEEGVGSGVCGGGREGTGRQELTITTGLYQECLHQGRGQDRVCPLRNRNIFCTKVIIKAQLLLSRSLRMDDLRTLQKDLFLFLSILLVFRNDETVFFCMTKCRLFIGSCAR